MNENHPPGYIPAFIQDKFGERYRVNVSECSADSLNLLLSNSDNRSVGVVVAILHSDGLKLEDIHLFENVPPREWKTIRYCKRLLRLNLSRTDFRYIGLGSQLLDMVIAHAKYLSIRHIYGGIVARDLSNHPDLYEFYRSRGFVITEGGETHPIYTARIDLYLD